MPNILTKDIGVTVLSPAVAGSPGRAPTPAYCVTTTRMEYSYPTVYITSEDGSVVALPGSSIVVPVTTTVCYPAVPGIPPVPSQPAITSSQLNPGWNAGAYSAAPLLATGSALFSVEPDTVGAVVGLHADGAMVFNYVEAAHALYFRRGFVSVLELGIEKTGAVPFVAADVFRIERSGSIIRYYQNTTLLYISTAPSYGTQFLESSLYLGGDAVVNASLTTTTTVGRGTGTAALRPVAAYGGALSYGGGAVLKALSAVGGIAYSNGDAAMAPITSNATGYREQGGNAVMLPVGALGSNKLYAGGDAVLLPLTASGTGYLERVVAGGPSTGDAILLPLTASGTGFKNQGGGAVLLPLQAAGSNKPYASGNAILAPLTARGESSTVPKVSFGSAPLGYIGAAGLGTTSNITITPAKSLGDSKAAWAEGQWVGLTVYLTSGAGAGQSALITVNTGQALLFNTVWSTVPDATSWYEIRDVFGNVVASGYVTPATSSMMPLNALGANYAYAGGNAVLAPLTAFGAPLIKLKFWAFIAAPMGTLTASVRDSTGENAANITAPMAKLSIFMGMGAKVNAPTPTLSASATGTNWLKASVTAPRGTLAATGTVAGTSQASITAPKATVIGYGGMIASVTLTGKATVTARVNSGGVLRANIVGPMATLPLFEVRAESYMRANIIAPMGKMGATLQAWIVAPMATLTAIGTAVVAATYEAYAINLNHTPRRNEEPVDELTRYTNFPFTHIVRYQNSYFGVNSTGLYLLEGTTDAGTTIPWAFKTAQTDFKTPMQKTVGAAYFGGRLGPATTITLYAGEGTGVAYAHTTPRGALAQNYRQVFGKGVKARYYALGAAGTGTLELDDIELDIHTLTRRV